MKYFAADHLKKVLFSFLTLATFLLSNICSLHEILCCWSPSSEKLEKVMPTTRKLSNLHSVWLCSVIAQTLNQDVDALGKTWKTVKHLCLRGWIRQTDRISDLGSDPKLEGVFRNHEYVSQCQGLSGVKSLISFCLIWSCSVRKYKKSCQKIKNLPPNLCPWSKWVARQNLKCSERRSQTSEALPEHLHRILLFCKFWSSAICINAI